MSMAACRQAIEGKFATVWGATTEVAWPNTAFTPPANAAWVQPVIQFGGRHNPSLGDEHKRITGALIIRHFWPPSTGVAADYSASAVLEGLNNTTQGGVRFSVVEPMTVGVNTEDGWALSVYRVNFRYDEQ